MKQQSEKGNKKMVGHLKDLLRSRDKNNQMIAVETIKSSEIYRKQEFAIELFSLLYIYYHLAYDPSLRKAIMDILTKYGTEALKKFLPEKVIQFKNTEDEARVCNDLLRIEQKTGLSGEIMAGELYLHPIHTGKKYIVHYGTDTPLKYKIIEEFLKVDTLNLSPLKLDFIPQEITYFVSIKKLRVKKSFVKVIPEFLLQFTHLEVLEISECQVEEFPLFLENHPGLKQLLIFWNQITTLPSSIKGFKHLQKLDLGLNKLMEIPEEFLNFPALKSLDLQSNLLIQLPYSLGNLRKLQTLDLRNNIDLKLDASIFQKLSLKELKYWKLQHNKI